MLDLYPDDGVKRKDNQSTLFHIPEKWDRLWRGMPEYVQEDRLPWGSLQVNVRSLEDLMALADLLGQKVSQKTRSVWWPEEQKFTVDGKRYEGGENPRHPIYIISKGRSESRLTAKALDAMKVPYHIVIEPQELDVYAAVIAREKILTLPFSNLGKGSIPARNWVWQHAIESGATHHWILDDNLRGFLRLHRNAKLPVASGAIFKAAEDFVDRYSNMRMAGFQYDYFAKRKQKQSPYILNTRIYSCILIDNSIQHRWRGRYNEDTDLSLRVLKDGDCTVLFNAFLCGKAATMTMKGGNTDELYQADGRLKMANSLKEQHPDCVEVVWKFSKWHHQVDYTSFKKNKLIEAPNLYIQDTPNNYGMVLRQNSQKLFKCNHPKCPGYSYKASESRHPVSTCTDEGIADEQLRILLSL